MIGIWRPRRVGDDGATTPDGDHDSHGDHDTHVDVRRAHRLLDRLQHRGPDGRAIWHGVVGDGAITLGLVRLAIVAPGLVASVAVDGGARADDVIAAVTNGELYNHAALRRLVGGAAGVDTALVPALFRALGPAWTTEARGMFGSVVAVAGRLHLFRDPLGKKPLFYRRRGDGWVVASEQKGLFAGDGDDLATIDPRRAARAFARGFLDDDEPLLAGVHAVPPGGHVVLDGHGHSVGRVVAFDEVLTDRRPRRATGAPDASAFDDDVTRVERLLGRAIARRVTTAVPARVLLSGGMDSAVVFAGAELRGATLAMPGDRDESAAAARVARRLRRDVDVVTPGPPDRASLRRVLWHTETPDVAGAWAMGSALLDHAAALAADGVKVVLSGEGADELFLGYPWLRLDAGVLRGRRHDPLVLAWSRTRQRHPGARAFERWRRLNEAPFDDAIVGALPGLFPDVELDQTQTTATTTTMAAAPHRARALQLEALGADMLTLPVLHADRLWMAHGIEARLPFLDVDVVRAALRLKASSLVSTRNEKPLVRALYARALGRAAPPKRGFSGARRPDDDGVLAMVDAVVARGLRVVSGPAVQRLRRDASDAGVVEVLWRVVVLEECADVLCGGGP